MGFYAGAHSFFAGKLREDPSSQSGAVHGASVLYYCSRSRATVHVTDVGIT